VKRCSACAEEKPLSDFSTKGKAGHHDRCKPCMREYQRQRYRANPEKYRQLSRQNYRRDPQLWNSRCGKNPEARRSAQQRYAATNQGRSVSAAKQARRRAVRKGNGYSVYNREAIFERDGGIYHLCLKPVDPDLRFPDPMSFSVDHCIPLCQGGSDTPENVATSHLVCNIRRPRR
jgi:hypothetical protein